MSSAYAHVLSALGRPAWVWSLDGELIDLNEAARGILGAENATPGMQWPAMDGCAEALERLTKKGEEAVFRTVEFVTGNGETRTRSCHLRPMLEDGKPVAILAICEQQFVSEISERVNWEAGKNVHSAIQAAGFGLFTVDAVSGRVEGTELYYELMGLPKDEVVTRALVRERIHPDDRADVTKSIDDLIAGRISKAVHDHRVSIGDGLWRWVMFNAELRSRDDLGMGPILCGCISDVTWRKDNEANLRKAQEDARELNDMFRATVQSGKIGPFSFDPVNKTGWSMDETARLLGYEPDEFATDEAGWFDLIHPDDAEGARAEMQNYLSGQSSVFDNQNRKRHKDGTYHWYRTVCQIIDRTDLGKPPMVAGIITNIDEQKKTEARLAAALAEAEQARDRLNRLTDNAPGALYEKVWRPNGEIVVPYFTAKMPEMFGITEDELRADGNATQKYMHPEDLKALMGQLREAHEKLKPIDQRLRIQPPGGAERVLSFKALTFAQDDGSIVSYASVSDVTRRVEAERLREEAASAAHVAHERLTRLSENSPTGLYELRRLPDGRFVMPYLNSRHADLRGVPAEVLRDDPEAANELVHPDDRDDLIATKMRSFKTLEPFDYLFRVQHPERGEIWLLNRSLPKRDADGSTVWYGATIDMTEQIEMERRTAEAARNAQDANVRLNSLAENAPSALYDFRIRLDGTMEMPYFNSKLAEIFGKTVEEVTADPTCIFSNISAEDYERVQNAMIASRENMTPFQVQYRVNHPERGEIWVLAQAVPSLDDEGTTIWHGASIDVTERIEMEQAQIKAAEELRAAHARLAVIADAAPVGIFESRRSPDGTLSLDYSSRRFDEFVGITSGSPEARMRQLNENVHPEDRQGLLDARLRAADKSGVSSHRFRLMHPQTGERWISSFMSPRKLDDGTVIYNGAYVDVTDDVRREEELRRAHELAEKMRSENEHQALHDPLTGLPNRRYFDQSLAKRFSQARAGDDDEPVFLVRIDCDRFKYINDTFGHEVGDAVLKHIGEILEHETRKKDFPARIGGDEFSIILEADHAESDAIALVKRIQDRLSEPLVFDGRRCLIQASFGIASVDPGKESSTDLLAFADAALYEAKEGGRNQLELFTPNLRAAINETRRLASELQDAVAREEFEPFYQAQIDTSTDTICGVETLMRWRHPERGVMAPDRFMRVADQLRIVPDLDRMMIQKARRELAHLRGRGLDVPRISFNVSSGRMQDPDVVACARELVDDGVRVGFELLESILLEDASDVFKFNLDLLRDSGVEIEIDDFGSGHASIIALMAISPSTLKIDQRIVAPVAEDPRSQSLVSAIIEIADTLGIGKIAEGVETREQVDILRRLGCPVVQGYYYSRPLPLSEFETFLREQPWVSTGPDLQQAAN